MVRSSFYTRTSNTSTRRGTALLVPLVAALVLPLLLSNFLAAAVTTADLAIANVEECLDCTEADCWYCESEHQFTDTGKHFSMCECDRSAASSSTSDQPRLGYCGTIYGEFNRYANTERSCIVPPPTTTTTSDFQHDDGGATAETGGDSTASYAKTIVILIALLPICCCLGICCGCGMYYYLAKLQREVEEERRLHECKTAMMKVVTARDLSSRSITKSGPHASSSAGFSYIVDTSNSTGDYSSSSSSTDEEEQQQQAQVPQHHVIT
jgi:hypothetical protein